jgi:hypothetical protein
LVAEWEVLEIRPSALFLRLLGFETEHSAVATDLSLQACDDCIFLTPLVASESVGGADHLADSEGLGMPVIAVQTALQMLVLLLLQQVVVVAFLFQKATLDAQAVVADLLGHGANGILIHGDEFGVLALLMFVRFNKIVFLEKFTFEFVDAGLYQQG